MDLVELCLKNVLLELMEDQDNSGRNVQTFVHEYTPVVIFKSHNSELAKSEEYRRMNKLLAGE